MPGEGLGGQPLSCPIVLLGLEGVLTSGVRETPYRGSEGDGCLDCKLYEGKPMSYGISRTYHSLWLNK